MDFCSGVAPSFLFFFFNDTATTEIYTLSLHDALPICTIVRSGRASLRPSATPPEKPRPPPIDRSEEHTSELQSQSNLVCRLLLEKKNEVYSHHHAGPKYSGEGYAK